MTITLQASAQLWPWIHINTTSKHEHLMGDLADFSSSGQQFPLLFDADCMLDWWTCKMYSLRRDSKRCLCAVCWALQLQKQDPQNRAQLTQQGVKAAVHMPEDKVNSVSVYDRSIVGVCRLAFILAGFGQRYALGCVPVPRCLQEVSSTLRLLRISPVCAGRRSCGSHPQARIQSKNCHANITVLVSPLSKDTLRASPSHCCANFIETPG